VWLGWWGLSVFDATLKRKMRFGRGCWFFEEFLGLGRMEIPIALADISKDIITD
jgi:hypothetical protein